jgi:hypothetical protein
MSLSEVNIAIEEPKNYETFFGSSNIAKNIEHTARRRGPEENIEDTARRGPEENGNS